jgi:hypothetical protein
MNLNSGHLSICKVLFKINLTGHGSANYNQLNLTHLLKELLVIKFSVYIKTKGRLLNNLLEKRRLLKMLF